MKTLGILFVLVFVAIFAPTKGYSNLKAGFSGNHSDKIYIEPSRLYFSDEGIFLQIYSDEWRSIGHICHDAQGYYIKISELNFDIEDGLKIDNNYGDSSEFHRYDADIIECGSRVSQLPKKWRCPYCSRRWFIGEPCQYEGCPTNQWKNNDQED